MDSDAQLAWIASAVDALEDIRADEVRAISAELRRSVTRHNQIVPEIAKLVHVRRQRSQESSLPPTPFAMEMKIHCEAYEMRSKARGDRHKMNAAYEWERQARKDAGLSVPPRPAPLSREELDRIPAHIRKMGLGAGFLEYRGGKLVETEL